MTNKAIRRRCTSASADSENIQKSKIRRRASASEASADAPLRGGSVGSSDSCGSREREEGGLDVAAASPPRSARSAYRKVIGGASC